MFNNYKNSNLKNVIIFFFLFIVCSLFADKFAYAEIAEPKVGSVVGGSEQPSTTINSGDYDSFIHCNDRKLKKKLKMCDVKMRTVGDVLQVSVTLINVSKKTLNLHYKFMWFDKDNFEIRADTFPWIPITLHSKEQKSIQGVAPNPAAKSFKIKISLAN
ncbi:MAG: YcfL family protein [Candidatus Hydrogenedentes bacterium]|nr:YcfL family protein [Candidatus Hydrogenedentota bacterium]